MDVEKLRITAVPFLFIKMNWEEEMAQEIEPTGFLSVSLFFTQYLPLQMWLFSVP